MKCVVFVPGIMGSELRQADTNKRVWPPSLSALVAKSVNAETLLDEDLVATRPIESVTPFYSVYRSILRDIEACGYSIDGSERRFIPFAYDWRQANERSARLLAERLAQQEVFDEIVLIGHSMGGLVLRYLIESGEFNEQPWFENISQLITLGTPHSGATEALKQVAGLMSNLGMSASNVKTLVSDPRYPSAYQLIAPSGSAMTLRAPANGRLPDIFDPFDRAIVSRYDLQTSNIEASKAFWSKLSSSKRPAKIKYFSFVGAAHKTLSRLEWTGTDLRDLESSDSGDGTVPISSSVNTSIPHSFSQKKHASIFSDRKLRAELFRMLGAPLGVVPHTMSDAAIGAEMAASDVMGISTDREEYSPVDSLEIVVSFVKPQTNPRCRFQLMAIDPDSESGDQFEEIGETISINFQGVSLENFKFSISIDLVPGVYELLAAGQVDDPERTFFVVAE